MVLNLVRDKGVPAFVNDASVLWPCTLKILHSNAQFVVSLEHTISTHSVDDEQLFTLRYEGDNLVPGKSSLKDIMNSHSNELLHNIARAGQPRFRTLSLMLKARCSVWYPHGFGNEVSSLHTHFHELLTLARATEVRILFDINWLGKDNLARLQSAVEGSRQLTGVPVIPRFTHLYQQADWCDLDLIQDAKSGACALIEDVASEAVPSIEYAVAKAPFEDELHDAPPPYAHASSKRPRNSESSSWIQHRYIANAYSLARSSLTPDSPQPKRFLQDPTCAPSPTERASSLSSSTATVQVDVFQDIVTSAVKKVLPDMLRAQLPNILQDLLPSMLAGPSPSPSLSPTPPSRQIANAPIQHPRTSSRKPTSASLFRAVISNHTKTNLQSIFTDALDRASELHNSAEVEFDEYLGDTRLEFATAKEDHLAAFDQDCDERLVEFKDRLAEKKEETEVEVGEHADKVVVKAWDRLNMLNMLDKEVWCRCNCLHVATDKQRQRAMSLPF
jgi:hypothetical protein